MSMSSVVLFHIIIGSIVLCCGLIALFSRKGSTVHRVAGSVFVVSMLVVAGNGLYLATIINEASVALKVFTIIIGLLAMYLVVTSWVTIKRNEGEVGHFEKVAFIFSMIIAAVAVFFGMEVAAGTSGDKELLPAQAYYYLAGLPAFFAILDLTIIFRRGVSGKQRIARHLLRMCFAMFIAVTIVFQGNNQVFPADIRDSNIMLIPVIAILVLMVFWVVRVLFTKWYNSEPENV